MLNSLGTIACWVSYDLPILLGRVTQHDQAKQQQRNTMDFLTFNHDTGLTASKLICKIRQSIINLQPPNRAAPRQSVLHAKLASSCLADALIPYIAK
ncbi:hypothetical protein A9308_09275 [Moraxella atlantae]|uniref:Uncharacterized protein n=1 Tax=Faucicola atlantae TaxID=34059 RepID=A0A1B8QFH7_9GAMM|nr:hypothetical protein A9308_09275 [Moraxella atlantae]OBX80711.1 hypothetical protein A9306_00920 [Moraxella atlantae]